MHFPVLHVLAPFAALAISAGAVRAQDASELPLWELGVSAVGRAGAEYPSSSEYRGGVSVLPYLTYRGRLFELGGDQFARVVPFRGDRLEFGVSLDGASALESRNNALRGALPDLDALAEFGPEVNYRFADTPAIFGEGRGRFEASLQTRGVFSFGDGIEHVGNLVRPALRYRQNGVLRPGSRVSMSIGPVFASEGVHDFFYEVPAGTMGLPAYDAVGGYLGTEVAASVRYPLSDRSQFVAGVGLTLLSGAANTASPLFDEEVNFSAFLGVRYSLWQSERKTTRDR